MQITINGRFFTQPNTGIGQYCLNLIPQLAREMGDWQFEVVLPEKFHLQNCPPNLKFTHLPEKQILTKGLSKVIWEQFTLPKYLQKNPPDIIWTPYNLPFWFFRFPKAKNLLTIHDVIPWQHPAYRKTIGAKIQHFFIERRLNRVDAIITVSQDSAENIQRHLHLPQSKITVIPNAAAPVFSEKQQDLTILKKHLLEAKKYFIYVGGYDPRKNVEDLVKHFPSDKKLVLVGATKNFAAKNIITTAQLSPESLAALYQNAYALINISSFEGFNLPIVEAAAAQIPMILADTKVNREISKSLALYIKKPQEISQKITELQSHYLKHSANLDPLKNSYSWQKSAKLTSELLKKLA